MGQQSITLDQGLLALLGANITSFPLNEEAYIEALKLKHQQEITKQQYYKLELANKNLSIIQLALKGNIPPELIVQLCVDKETSLTELERNVKSLIQKEETDKNKVEAKITSKNSTPGDSKMSSVLAQQLPQISVSQPTESPTHKPASSISNLSSLSISSDSGRPGKSDASSNSSIPQPKQFGSYSPILGQFNRNLNHSTKKPNLNHQTINPNLSPLSTNPRLSPNLSNPVIPTNLPQLNQNLYSNIPQIANNSPREIVNRQLSYIPQQDQRSQVLHPNYPPTNAPQNRNYHHIRSSSQPAQVHSYSSDNIRRRATGNTLYPDGLNPSVPPMNYRFGTGTSKRPLSPAKIGAQAVANLATPTSPYRHPTSNTRRTRSLISNHQRHSSMPSEKELSNQSISLPMGGTSTIQVKPLPAQPLININREPPSQESMTSFQHIIQFHHWKPEEGDSLPSTGNTIFKGHKRHKSTSEATPIGFQGTITGLKSTEINHTLALDTRIQNLAPSGSKTEDETVDDITVDENQTEVSLIVSPIASKDKDDEKDVHASSKEGGSVRNIGRYPHDILSG